MHLKKMRPGSLKFINPKHCFGSYENHSRFIFFRVISIVYEILKRYINPGTELKETE